MWIFWTIVLVVIGVVLMVYSWTGDGWQGIAGMWSITLLLKAIIIAIANIQEPKPTALDVYQNKTTLEYTIRDGEVVDSIVVFKNK